MKKFSIPILIIIAAFAIIFLQLVPHERNASISTLSSGDRGLSIFNALAQRVANPVVDLLKEPLLNSERLTNADLVMILSPLAPLSNREAQLVDEYIKKGGHLYLSFHNDATQENLKSLLAKLEIPVKTVRDEKFRNGVTATVPSDNSVYYSYLPFEGVNCPGERKECFYRSYQHGEGKITLVSGLPPFSNALISLGSNRDYAFSILDSHHHIVVDEYRHHFTKKSYGELLGEPTFFLPTFGLTLAAILFFTFGTIHISQLYPTRDVASPSNAYHGFNERLLSGLSKKAGQQSGCVISQAAYLEKLFPADREAIAHLMATTGSLSWQENARMLALLHREILHKKGYLS